MYIWSQKQTKKAMTITNEKMTKEEAKKVMNSIHGSFVSTPHNKKMVANHLRDVIAKLHGEAPKYV